MSGQRNCEHQEVCPKLDHKDGEHSRWRCEGINPYKEDIPEGTACHTSLVELKTVEIENIFVLLLGVHHGEMKLDQ